MDFRSTRLDSRLFRISVGSEIGKLVDIEGEGREASVVQLHEFFPRHWCRLKVAKIRSQNTDLKVSKMSCPLGSWRRVLLPT